MTFAESPRRSLKTVAAAQYLGISVSLLRKMRTRGPDDPAGVGPAFIKLSPMLVVYEIDALNSWLDGHRARSASRASAPEPRAA